LIIIDLVEISLALHYISITIILNCISHLYYVLYLDHLSMFSIMWMQIQYLADNTQWW